MQPILLIFSLLLVCLAVPLKKVYILNSNKKNKLSKLK